MSPAEVEKAAGRGQRGHLVVVDAANCLYRAFFALPPLRTATGFPTNAAYGFVTMLRKVIREEAPDHMVVVFDPPGGKSVRQEIYSEYKAQRDKEPEDLSAQMPAVRELIEAHRLAVMQVPGCEADDVIATLVAKAPKGWRVTILSTDKDLMQLVSEEVCLLDTMKERRYDPEAVEQRFGVPPDRVLDMRALVGDPSDNIPGVRGIGEKGAAKLMQKWGSLDSLLEHVEDVKPTRAKNALLTGAEDARLSKTLSTLRADIELPMPFEELALGEPDLETLRALFERFEFVRLLDELDPGGSAARAAEPAESAQCEICRDLRTLADALRGLAPGQTPVLAAVGSTESALREAPVGLAIALGPEQVFYLPVAHEEGPNVDAADLAAILEETLGEGRWGGRDTKLLQVWFAEHGVFSAPPTFDIGLAAFLVDPAAARHTPALAAQHLGRPLSSWEELAGRGAKATPPAALEVAAVAAWVGEEVSALAELAPLLEAQLERDGSDSLYRDVELPLTAVLAAMERTGVRIDEDALRALSKEYEGELATIEAEIHRLAGETFTINSPKQLQHILFEKLKLPSLRKTKTGFSTDEGVLERLSSQHPLPEKVLHFRRLAKLKSTYVDALPRLVLPTTGRLHPTFNQSGAATGRLSAANPHVQNIPIRTDQGLRIREAFIPREGGLLLSADYSQIELRILAHYSEDESLLAAFRDGEDIHRRTAAGVLGIEPAAVDEEQRARAKAINFGIIYGSTAFGIANQLGIASAEAQATIDAYFERYRGVRRFLDESVEQAKARGYAQTLLGRRRYLPDLASRNRVLRNAAERMAVNSVIQGTAADLMKRAMVRVARALAERPELRAEMILQVHDELVFEVEPGQSEALTALVREQMEGAAALRVPLDVDVGVGANWKEAH
jgi:DNA polymerase-1